MTRVLQRCPLRRGVVPSWAVTCRQASWSGRRGRSAVDGNVRVGIQVSVGVDQMAGREVDRDRRGGRVEAKKVVVVSVPQVRERNRNDLVPRTVGPFHGHPIECALGVAAIPWKSVFMCAPLNVTMKLPHARVAVVWSQAVGVSIIGAPKACDGTHVGRHVP